jgi:TetR/AcrR family transcriptional regulator
MEIHKRAVSAQQKNEKITLILEAARLLLAKSEYDSISMIDIAHQAGLAKGTLYLYFKTKESLFLSLTEILFAHWFDEIDQALQDYWVQELQIEMTIEEFAEIVGASLDHHPLLLKLIPILHITLEHQADFAQAYSYKKGFLIRMEKTGELIERSFSFVPQHKGYHLLLQIYTCLIGLQHLSQRAEAIQQVLELSELSPLKIDLRTELQIITIILLKGWEAKQNI